MTSSQRIELIASAGMLIGDVVEHEPVDPRWPNTALRYTANLQTAIEILINDCPKSYRGKLRALVITALREAADEFAKENEMCGPLGSPEKQ